MAKGKGRSSSTPQKPQGEVRVPVGTDNAVLLLAAAEEAGLDPGIVRVENGNFVVPAEVADKAGVESIPDDTKEK